MYSDMSPKHNPSDIHSRNKIENENCASIYIDWDNMKKGDGFHEYFGGLQVVFFL